MPFIYSERYFADIGLHVFPIVKYRRVYEKLLHSGKVGPEHFIAPEPASQEQLLLVHTREYLNDLESCRWTRRTVASELPISEEIIALFALAAGGTTLAARQAVKEGWAVHLSGGFHHAFADKAEGFCYLNDLAVAARVAQQENGVKKVAIIDCDVHQGNGTAVIFQHDRSVFTFSMHQRDLYPIKQESDLDIHLPIGIGDGEYLEHLHDAVRRIFREFQPDLVLYQAGADPYRQDQLGSLDLTLDGLRQRDEMVLRRCHEEQVPIAVTLGGGYAYNTEDTVQIHLNSCLVALEIFEGDEGERTG